MLRKIVSKVTGKPEQQLKNEALREAAIKGKLRRVRHLLDDGADVDYKDVNKLTPLYFAASHGHTAVLRLLLERGADPNPAPDCKLDGSALVSATAFEYFDAVKILVEFKADLEITDSQGFTPMHEACWRGKEDIAIFLIEAGSKTETKSRLGHTPLQNAVGYELRRTARALCQHGADAGVTNKRGEDMRTAAANKGWDDVVEAIDRYRRDREESRRHAIEEARKKKEGFDAAIEAAPVLQNNIVVKKPIVLKPGR